MLGSLSLMACTLMLAAVPSLSSSMQPREDVNLPAIGSVVPSDGSYIPISPVGLGESVTTVVDTGNIGVDLTFRIGDFYASVDTSEIPQADYGYDLYFDGDVLVVDSSIPLASASSALVYVQYSSADDLTLNLPDFSYWVYDDGSYSLSVFLDLVDNTRGAYYGNSVSGTSLSYTLAELGEDVNPIGAVGDGLGIVGALGGALSDGFDGVFLDNGALTAVGTFSFVLLGIGISVGICKKCFNWVTGRHGI